MEIRFKRVSLRLSLSIPIPFLSRKQENRYIGTAWLELPYDFSTLDLTQWAHRPGRNPSSESDHSEGDLP